MGVNRCLICYKECPPSRQTEEDDDDPLSPALISKELHAMFILRNVFEVPHESLREYLVETGTNPSHWIAVCGSCKNLVEKAKRIYKEILDASRRFRKVKGDIIQYLRRNRKNVKVERSSRSAGGMMRVTDSTRKFVNEHNYSESLVDPFVGGDCQATQLLFSSNVVTEVSSDDLNENIKIENTSDDDGDEDYREDPPFDPESPPEGSNCSFNREEEEEDESPQTPASSVKAVVRRKVKKKDPPVIHKAKGSATKPDGDIEWLCSCGRTYTGSEKLRRHVREANMDSSQMHACPICDKKFKRGWDVRRHMAHHTGPDGVLKGGAAQKILKSVKSGSSSKQKLEEEGMGASDQEEVEEQVTSAVKHERNDPCIMADGTEFWKCSCEKIYLTEANLLQHVEEQSGVLKTTKISCSVCDMTFRRRFDRNQHMKKVHGVQIETPTIKETQEKQQEEEKELPELEENSTEEIPNTPSNKSSINDSSLGGIEEHDELGLFATEDGVELWNCKCGKSYNTQGTLHRHVKEKTMDPSKWMHCDHCGKSFQRLAQLKRHVAMVHDKITYPCDKCGKSFSVKGNLRVHQMSCT